jgi:hypothetical protein
VAASTGCNAGDVSLRRRRESECELRKQRRVNLEQQM